jgi:hypothetical protein
MSTLDYQVVQKKLMSFIQQENTDEAAFTEMAVTLFHYQYAHNQPFRKYCRKRGVSPSTITHYREIPPVPIAAFKQTTLSSCPPEQAERVFTTSGTTNPEHKGKHYHRDLDVWNLSMTRHFQSFMLPDLTKIKLAILFPTEEELPNSSLAHYLHMAKQTFGLPGSEFMYQDRLDIPHLLAWLREAERAAAPVMLLGATFSFIHFFDYCREHGLQFMLPPGSRLMDTGGSKGRSREIAPDAFRQMAGDLLSIPEDYCMNMYGMTELSSQFYQSSLRDRYFGGVPRKQFVAPHWVRTIIVDPETMIPKPEGVSGIIVHYDLANLNSTLAIMTEDVGIREGDGFTLLGRAAGAEAKGCSLTIETFMLAARGGHGEREE